MINIPETGEKRIVIVGCGFAGLTLARKLKNAGFQVVIIDKHNYHQFPPLFYQVASAGLEASSILFPLRKIFQNYKDYHIRKAEVISVDSANNLLETTAGDVKYDYLVLAHGATNSYFGSVQMQQHSKGMKSIAEVLDLRNSIGKNLAVVELPFIKFQGLFGWYVWMFIHLMSIVGVKNKLVIFLNWAWKYFTYDQSTRLILRPKGHS